MELLTDALTDQDKTILVMLNKGYMGKEIGAAFNRSESWGFHAVQDVCDKLNARTPAQAVGMAITAGIIE